MSIIFLADDFPPDVGGIQTYSCELARAVAGLGHEVTVVASSQEGDEQFDATLPFPTVRVPTDTGRPTAAMNLAAGARQAAADLGESPDCLVATKWSPEGPGALLARSELGCPLILLGHGGEFSHSGYNPLKWLVQRAVLRGMTLCLANSHFTADLFRKARVPPERIGIIYGGVRPERFEVKDEAVATLRDELGLGRGPVLLTVGRLVERKGHDTVLSALPSVLEKVPDLIYVIAGDGAMREALEECIEKLNLGESVRIIGRVSEERLPALYAATDLFVMASRPVRGKLAEGFGLAFLEAACVGVPGIGTDFGGIPDAVVDGETGLLVDPDDAESLASAITELLAADGLRRRLGDAARERALEDFTWERVAERFLDELSTLP